MLLARLLSEVKIKRYYYIVAQKKTVNTAKFGFIDCGLFQSDFRIAYKLPWRLTEVPFLKFNFVSGV